MWQYLLYTYPINSLTAIIYKFAFKIEFCRKESCEGILAGRIACLQSILYLSEKLLNCTTVQTWFLNKLLKHSSFLGGWFRMVLTCDSYEVYYFKCASNSASEERCSAELMAAFLCAILWCFLILWIILCAILSLTILCSHTEEYSSHILTHV